MPKLLKKKRALSTSAVVTTKPVEAESLPTHQTPPTTIVNLPSCPPSPSSSRTAVSHTETPQKSQHKRRGTGGSSDSTGSSSSLMNLKVVKLSPLKSLVATSKQVKRQVVKRLDSALNQVTSSTGSRGTSTSTSTGTTENAEEGKPGSKARAKLLPTLNFPSFSSSPRKRTVSSSNDPAKLKKLPRNRTISCPVVFDPPVIPDHSNNAMASDSSLPSLALSAPPMSPLGEEEESTAKGAAVEGLVLSASDVFGSPVSAGHVQNDDGPDPFLVDDEGDALSSEEGSLSASASRQSALPTTAAHDVSLSISPSPSPLPADLSSKPLPTPMNPNVNKDVPPPPVSDDDEDEDEAPELYLPGLVIPTMFLPIPNVRRSFPSNHLTWWLSRSRLTVI